MAIKIRKPIFFRFFSIFPIICIQYYIQFFILCQDYMLSDLCSSQAPILFAGIWSLTQVCWTSEIPRTIETAFWHLFRPRRGRFIHSQFVGKFHGQVHFGKELKNSSLCLILLFFVTFTPNWIKETKSTLKASKVFAQHLCQECLVTEKKSSRPLFLAFFSPFILVTDMMEPLDFFLKKGLESFVI